MTVPLMRPGVESQSVVLALVPSVTKGGGHSGVDEGGMQADHGVGGPSRSADSSVRCKPISEPLPPALMQALPPTLLSSTEDNNDKLLREKADTLVTMTWPMHDPVGVGPWVWGRGCGAVGVGPWVWGRGCGAVGVGP